MRIYKTMNQRVLFCNRNLNCLFKIQGLTKKGLEVMHKTLELIYISRIYNQFTGIKLQKVIHNKKWPFYAKNDLCTELSTLSTIKT